MEGIFHEVTNLFGVNATKGTSAHGEVLAEGSHRTAVHVAHAGDDAITRHRLTGHAELVTRVLGHLAELHERPRFEERNQPLASGHEAFFVAFLNFVSASALFGRVAGSFESFQQFGCYGHDLFYSQGDFARRGLS